LLAFLAAAFVLVYYVFFYVRPSCFDKIKNGNEEGIDCGGSCAVQCVNNQIPTLNILWNRMFQVDDGVFNVIAYVENPNYLFSTSVHYRFKIYDSGNFLIAERNGEVFVPAKKSFGVFEGAIRVGQRIPDHSIFEFLSSPVWQKPANPEPPLSIANVVLSGENSTPKIEAVLNNPNSFAVSNIKITAIVYDAGNTAVAASETIIDSVGREGSQPVFWSWPKPFPGKEVRIETLYEIIPK